MQKSDFIMAAMVAALVLIPVLGGCASRDSTSQLHNVAAYPYKR